jgi:hypothetical protein
VKTEESIDRSQYEEVERGMGVKKVPVEEPAGAHQPGHIIIGILVAANGKMKTGSLQPEETRRRQNQHRPFQKI